MARRSDERDAARAEYIARMEKDGEVNLRQLADDLRVGIARTPEARRTAGKQKRRGQPRRRGTCRE